MNRDSAKNGATQSLAKSFTSDAEKWELRSRKLTADECLKNIDKVILWRIIEDVDGRTL